jgi:hypothetical protein
MVLQFGTKWPLKLDSFPPTKTGNRGAVSHDVFILKRWVPGLQETDSGP